MNNKIYEMIFSKHRVCVAAPFVAIFTITFLQLLFLHIFILMFG